ncbi:unnamed protein product [Cunninghamella echinulata]
MPKKWITMDGDKYYIQQWGKYNNLLAGEDIMGDVIHTLEEWYNNPYKYEIMKNAIKFKEFLHKMSAPKWYGPSNFDAEMGMGPKPICTPIMTIPFTSIYIEDYIDYFEKAVNQVAEGYITIPKSLRGTDLGRRILSDLRDAEKKHLFGGNVFCHMGLNYRSFVMKNNVLIGIRQWQYSGYYPAELENIIHSVL